MCVVILIYESLKRFIIVAEIPPGFLAQPEDIKCIVSDDVEFKCMKTKQRYGVTWFINDTPVDEEMIKSKQQRLDLKISDDGLEHILSFKNVQLIDNGTIHAMSENTVKSRVASLNSVPICFESTPKDTKIFVTETAKFEATTNKAGVEVSLKLLMKS